MKRTSVVNEMHNPGPGVYYQLGFRKMIEDHLTWLRNHEKTNVINIAAKDALRYHGDFFGLLSFLEIPAKFHWILMRLNGYEGPRQYDHEDMALLIIDDKVMSDLERKYQTLDRIQ